METGNVLMNKQLHYILYIKNYIYVCDHKYENDT